ncbi:P-loop ATPase, Sll1717 family [Streptococcus oralis]|jgi:funZ protein, putative|uniref:P-loop ATPase, Sll1717 family n=1 Tax=Streptococcus oralis TaxID=1303 RepID=UPI001BA21E2A|nr:hypothetical protein [Streptococcus oralis]MBR8666243.1 hypothetical protein [Streptococcus oralis]
MKTISELNLGFIDAENYSKRNNKKMFNDIFVKNAFLDKILEPNRYFLIGEKGTGKTAYSVFLGNNDYKNNKTILRFISSTEYERFYTLKKMKHLELSDFVSIWKVILLLILSQSVIDDSKIVSNFRHSKLQDLKKAIDSYYLNAFTPEIMNALRFIDESGYAAKLLNKYIELGGSSKETTEFSEHRFQMNLLYIERQFSETIKKIKLSKNVNIFIDGIDIRPDTIPYEDYIQCIRGLASACWQLNTDLFQNVRDSKGHFKIVLLLRPDIYSVLNLQNSANKLSDNSVFLDWRTTYTEYQNSNLYDVSKKILEYEQENVDLHDIWEEYFQWKFPTTNKSREYDTAFMNFLKISLSRPRDIIKILQLLQDQMNRSKLGNNCEFSQEIYESDEFQNSFSEYFMSALKDQLSFYYNSENFEIFVKFFDYFKKRDFEFKEFQEKHGKLLEYINSKGSAIPEFIDDEKKFLQLLYDSNVIAAIDNAGQKNEFYHFSYREKSISNISPKVPISEEVTYRFHYGLYKKANLGRF